MKIIIIHGLGSTSKDNWFTWLKDNLSAMGHEVLVPNFPKSNTPNLENWLTTLAKCDVDENTILVGHSLGSPLILNYLQQYNVKIKAAILVAGFCTMLQNSELNALIKDFISGPFDWDKIRNHSSNFIVLNSDNDPYVPIENAMQLGLSLGVDVQIIRGAGHFNEINQPLLKKIVSNLAKH